MQASLGLARDRFRPAPPFRGAARAAEAKNGLEWATRQASPRIGLDRPDNLPYCPRAGPDSSGVSALQHSQRSSTIARTVAILEWFWAGASIVLAVVHFLAPLAFKSPTPRGIAQYRFIALLFLLLAMAMAFTARAMWSTDARWARIASALLALPGLLVTIGLLIAAVVVPMVLVALHNAPPSGEMRVHKEAALSFDLSDIPTGAIVGTLFGLILFAVGFYLLRRSRQLMDKPFSKVRSAAIGLVELQGTVVGPYVMSSPITRQPTLYHRVRIEVHRPGNDKELERRCQEAFHLPFFFKDQTGVVLVNPDQAEIDLPSSFFAKYSPSMIAEGRVAAGVPELLRRHQVPSGRSIEVTECCLRPNARVFIVGTLSINPDLKVAPVPHITQGPSGYIPQPSRPESLALPEVRRAEVSQATAAAAAPVGSSSAPAPSPQTGTAPDPFPEENPTLVCARAHSPYMISWRRREEASRRLRGWAVALIVLGAATAISSLAPLLVR